MPSPSPSPSPTRPQPPLLFLDGAMGTYLEDHHAVTFTHATHPAWSSSVPASLLSRAHAAYAAHADILLTATYQACTANMGPGPEARTRMHALLTTALAAAAAAAGPSSSHHDSSDSSAHPRRSVALSLGSYGATMHPSTEYSGDYPVGLRGEAGVVALGEWHRARLGEYVGGGWSGWAEVEYVAFETLVGVEEVGAVRGAMGRAWEEMGGDGDWWGGKKWWVCVNYPRDRGGDEDGDGDVGRGRGEPVTPRGEDARMVARAMFEEREGRSRPWGVGVNCTKLRRVAGVVEAYEAEMEAVIGNVEASGRSRWPWLVLYPDGAQNLVYNTTTKTWDETDKLTASSLSWAAQMKQILDPIIARGKWPGIVAGGCCKTTPEDIAELRRIMARAER